MEKEKKTERVKVVLRNEYIKWWEKAPEEFYRFCGKDVMKELLTKPFAEGKNTARVCFSIGANSYHVLKFKSDNRPDEIGIHCYRHYPVK